MRLLLLLPLSFLLAQGPTSAVAAEDVIARARAASAEGNRAEGLGLLEAHLEESPRDVDARLVYGLMLSWDGRYDDARRELQRVLAQTPGYTDAKVALMNVEWWSDHEEPALALAREILSEQANHPQATHIEQRLGASARRWEATASYTLDWFDDDRELWHEASLALKRETPLGSIILRGSHAERFSSSDQLVEVEAYPSFRPGTYGFVAFGVATRADLYPTLRFAFDLYQSLPWSLEASLGYRRLEFSSATDIVVTSLSKYWGNWMFTGRVYHVPGSGGQDSTSYHASVRRYFGEAGRSFVGMRYSHGFSREEVRNAADLTTVDSDSLTAQTDLAVWERYRVAFSGGFSRQERAGRATLWQATFGTSLGVRF